MGAHSIRYPKKYASEGFRLGIDEKPRDVMHYVGASRDRCNRRLVRASFGKWKLRNEHGMLELFANGSRGVLVDGFLEIRGAFAGFLWF